VSEVAHDRRWWPFGPPAVPARPRLFCLPFAGGGASAYRTWRRTPEHGVDVCPVGLPGREARIREAPFRRLGPLADALVEVLRPWTSSPWALFGTSMGALVAHELAHRLPAAGAPAPRALFVAAAIAPDRRRRTGTPLHALSDAGFTDALRRLAGTPAEVLEHAELMELLLPALRADFELYETADDPPRAPLDCPIVAFSGARDAEVPAEDLAAWSARTRGGFRAITLEAGHFFLDSHASELLHEIAHELGTPP